MYDQKDIETANKTSRNSSAIGAKAITPKFVMQYLKTCKKADTTILDFGAGKAAAHAQTLLKQGWKCTAYEFGDNTNPDLHDKKALARKYNIVYASNVLNTQSNITMALETIEQVLNVVKKNGIFVCNYPLSPRKADITVEKMVSLLSKHFKTITRVGGTKTAPLWKCKK